MDETQEPLLGLDDAAPGGHAGVGARAVVGVRTEPYRVLARKYRPSDFTGLIGQEALVRTLTNAFASGRIAHAFMLTGVRGVGKTTTARIIARALNCIGPDGKRTTPTIDPCGVCEPCRGIAESRFVDVQEMDGASNNGIEEVRQIIDSVRYAPAAARYKVYIIDEVHMLSKQAFNGLLKTLEEPPPHVKFIFATTEIRKVPVTVLSRCQRFDLRRIETEALSAHLSDDCGKGKDRDRTRGVVADCASGGRLGARRAVAARSGYRPPSGKLDFERIGARHAGACRPRAGARSVRESDGRRDRRRARRIPLALRQWRRSAGRDAGFAGDHAFPDPRESRARRGRFLRRRLVGGRACGCDGGKADRAGADARLADAAQGINRGSRCRQSLSRRRDGAGAALLCRGAAADGTAGAKFAR